MIVGAGVNGIGTFRDLALQGVDVLLVDKGDFCSGASAASSHMLHGGLRYLENAEFRLVREALHERNRLLINAPHYARPLPTTIPIFSWLSGFLNAPLKFLNLRDKPSERGAVIIKLGLMMYDWFTRDSRVMPTHRLIGRKESLDLRPLLNPDIVCSAQYYDAWMPYPERICMELVMDTETLSPNARAINYVRLDGANGDVVTLRDELSGEHFTIKPRLVINAAGPWIDFANRAIGKPTKFIGGTKGSHILVDHPELHQATLGHEMFFENQDSRITLFFPLLDKVLIGTTDIHIDDPEQAECTEEEIDYMLDLVNHVFPKIKLDRSHIVFKFSGVRPLPSMETTTTGQISRDHSIQAVEPDAAVTFPVLALVGGKWTTFRAFAEQVTDKVLDRLKMSRKADTKAMPIGGGKDYPLAEAEQRAWVAALAAETGLAAEHVHVLFERYGTYARQVAGFMADGEDAMLQNHHAYSRREIEFLALQEKVVHLDDLILRRTLMGMLGQVTGALLVELADIIAPLLGWSESKRRVEVERAAQLLRDKHGVAPEKLRLPALPRVS
ncbi:MAG: glycerol-3-phosphate dehydrogenase/oxidase [Chloroflexi bacterium]|nr:glycerol-3-phosphate dehydrogenase/oxidase [Chloroflexota bacterium]